MCPGRAFFCSNTKVSPQRFTGVGARLEALKRMCSMHACGDASLRYTGMSCETCAPPYVLWRCNRRASACMRMRPEVWMRKHAT
eukprot:scaffold63523_cov20-Tisochrysis_lutea.AAC.8